MEKIKCKKCGKLIEGYNQFHVEFLMKQHKLSCDNKKKEIKGGK